ncbi:LysR family transcriptional regulator [Roseibium sp.]|uniref:LysR family transcriptional regulator n=1 Tax=Roseibium sp. TaxID=1936156 RepID=UPI002626CE54|nr:LysR family transcriptional regulator [Roseibium sp.]
MRYFAAAARHQNLSRAAEAVRVSQSVMSTSIDTMETELGLQLFERRPSKGARLTAAGRDVLVKVRAILDQVDSLGAEQGDAKAQVSGQLYVACFTPIAPIVLTPILRSFVKDFPLINVTILEGNPRHVFDLIHRGEADVGISYDEADMSAGLSSSALAVVPPHVVLAEGHPLSKNSQVSLHDISSEPLILLDLPSSREYYTSIFVTAGIKPNFAYRTENYEMVRSLVGAGLGVALLQTRPPERMTYSGAKVVCLPLLEETRKSTLMVSSTRQNATRASVRAFVEHCERRIRNGLDRRISVD